MIGYAYMLNQQNPFPISFGLVCLLIYAATRIGIFAGKLVQMMIGQAPETTGEESASVVAKRLVLGFGPQCIFVVICQVILGLTILPTPTTANLPQPLQKHTAQLQTQNIEQPKVEEVAEENIQPAVANTTVDNSSAKVDDNSSYAEKTSKSEDIVKPAKTSKFGSKIVRTKSANNVVSENTNVSASDKVAAYIPEKTLRAAGVNPSEVNVSSTPKTNTSTPTQANYSQTSTTAAQNKTQNNNNLHTKRYMGDDNPVSTSWGYYKQNSYPNVNNSAEQVNTVRSYSYNPTKY